MSHPKSRPIPWCAIALAILMPIAASAQEEGYSFRLSNFKLEFYGGYAPISAADLNTIASYEEAFLQSSYYQFYSTFVPSSAASLGEPGSSMS